MSLVRAGSVTVLEEHHVWRMSGKGDLRGFAAKTVEAFTVLESELTQERNHGNR